MGAASAALGRRGCGMGAACGCAGARHGAALERNVEPRRGTALCRCRCRCARPHSDAQHLAGDLTGESTGQGRHRGQGGSEGTSPRVFGAAPYPCPPRGGGGGGASPRAIGAIPQCLFVVARGGGVSSPQAVGAPVASVGSAGPPHPRLSAAPAVGGGGVLDL